MFLVQFLTVDVHDRLHQRTILCRWFDYHRLERGGIVRAMLANNTEYSCNPATHIHVEMHVGEP